MASVVYGYASQDDLAPRAGFYVLSLAHWILPIRLLLRLAGDGLRIALSENGMGKARTVQVSARWQLTSSFTPSRPLPSG